MEDQAVFSVASKCFGDVDEDEWIELTRKSVWSDFIDGARCLLQDARPLGETVAPTRAMRRYCPLQEFLAVGEVDALFSPCLLYTSDAADE